MSYGTTSEETKSSQVLSVEQLNLQIKGLLEGQMSQVWVRGELSNFKAHTSGHFYFSIKDAKSQISAVMFRGHNSRLKFKPVDGLEVILRGKVTVYEPRGNYQIMCDMMEPVGAGALQKAYEDLRNKLKNEGLFDLSRKRKIPEFPRHIAIITSPTGAAIRDILNILSRRAPSVKAVVIPTLVQGAAAAPQIVEALKKAYLIKNLDCIIIGRGGGSMEDLWAFNDETLARTLAVSPVPTISAVGHEIDFTICDFVADLRAPTPSAAAELVAKSSQELKGRILALERVLRLAMSQKIQQLLQKHLRLKKLLVDPRKKFADLILRNDDLMMRLERATNAYFERRHYKIQLLRNKLVQPLDLMKKKVQKFYALSSALDSLSPLKVVERGYSILTKNNSIVKSLKQISVGDQVSARLSDGEIELTVSKKE